MEAGNPPFLINIVVIAAVVSVLLTYGNSSWASPLVSIFNRWLRWIVFSFAVAVLIRELGLTTRPLWVLISIAFLGWFLGETMFNWAAIKALSQSPIALFPRFYDSVTGDEWPVQRRFIAIRDWLRGNGFSKQQSLKSDMGFGITLRTFVFESSDRKTRIHVVFIPQRSGNISACFSFNSLTIQGIRIVTDNLYIPFGGFYPDNWRLIRKTSIRRIDRLHSLHKKRIERSGAEIVEWSESPLDDLNDQQALLERINTKLGFLYPAHLREEYGKITTEGRYRVWKEIWLLNYLGISSSG